jgi:hypothetical protein
LKRRALGCGCQFENGAGGEMVDILWQQGAKEAAIAVEVLWSALQQTRTFALLCGYGLDIFDVEVQAEALPEVLRPHNMRGRLPTVDRTRAHYIRIRSARSAASVG